MGVAAVLKWKFHDSGLWAAEIMQCVQHSAKNYTEIDTYRGKKATAHGNVLSSYRGD